jgi:hypothetical protein
MAIRNNTTSIGMGGAPRLTSRGFNDMTARAISTEVARANYRKSFRSNFKVAELRNYVFKMVSSWSKEDKMAILAQYGDVKNVMRMGGRNINEQLTETLIIRLKEEDIQVLLRDIKSDELGLARKVRGIRNSQKKMASSFSTRNFEDIYNVARDTRNNRGIERAIRQYDNSFRIPRRVLREFPTLRRELAQVIPEIYDRVEMAGLAHRMSIEFNDGISQRDLVTRIINKTLLYVSLIMGRTRMSYSSAILQPEPYRELLQYTTYSWVAGSSGMGRDGITTLRQEALNARRMARERFTRRPQGVLGRIGRSLLSAIPSALMGTLNVLNPFSQQRGIGNRFMAGANTPYDFFGQLMGQGSPNEARLRRGAERLSRQNYMSLPDGDPNRTRWQRLMGLTDQDLLQEGIRLGLPSVRLGSPREREAYARRIMAISERDELRRRQLDRRAQRRARSWFGPKTLSAAEEAERQSLTGKPRANEGTNLPYVIFGGGGGAVDQANYAVRVWVVNGSPFSGAGSTMEELARLGYLTRSKDNVKLAKQTFDFKDASLRSDYNLSPSGGVSKPSGPFKGISSNDPFTIKVDNPVDAFKIKGARAIRVFDQSTILMSQMMKRAAAVGGKKFEANRELIAKTSFDMGITAIKRDAASPVYVVNKTIPVDAGALIVGLAKIFSRFIDPTGITGEIVGAELTKVASGGSGIDDLLDMAGLATGGRGRASKSLSRVPKYAQGVKSSNVSHFIAGDSLNGKPNEEQVSIDWTKKEFKVKPIPSMTGQELNKTGISQVTKMSSAERNEPMKVYAVNPGITDIVDVGSVKTSLINLVADMAGRLSSIENLLSVGNEQKSAIVAATSATAANINKLASKTGTGANPFAGGFPSDLDSILTGR